MSDGSVSLIEYGELVAENRLLTEQITALSAQVASLQQAQAEICICAALKMPDGNVYRGHRHDDAIQTAGKGGYSRDAIANAVQGFQTSRNRFVDRYEGMRLQRAAGLSSAIYGVLCGDMLFSEDLYLKGVEAVAVPQGDQP